MDDAFAMFENYLGIAQHKERAAMSTKNLTCRPPRTARCAAIAVQEDVDARRLQNSNGHLDDHVRMLKKMFVEDYGFDPDDVEENTPNIESLAVRWPLVHPDFQMLFRRHTQTRRARPDVKRFVQDLLERATDHAERVRARKRIHKHRSRLKQSAN